MDVQMPVLDGYEAARKIRELDRLEGTHTPILACTANAMSGDRELCLACGMDGNVAKPFRIEALLSAVSSLLATPGGHR